MDRRAHRILAGIDVRTRADGQVHLLALTVEEHRARPVSLREILHRHDLLARPEQHEARRVEPVGGDVDRESRGNSDSSAGGPRHDSRAVVRGRRLKRWWQLLRSRLCRQTSRARRQQDRKSRKDSHTAPPNGDSNRLRQGYGGTPKLQAKAETVALHFLKTGSHVYHAIAYASTRGSVPALSTPVF